MTQEADHAYSREAAKKVIFLVSFAIKLEVRGGVRPYTTKKTFFCGLLSEWLDVISACK